MGEFLVNENWGNAMQWLRKSYFAKQKIIKTFSKFLRENDKGTFKYNFKY